ncbi:hypothetical protein CBOM_07744 [Ceraceosorus bombacis]|uniref:Uncharacterized protein n=1 Tax=Ceraceosorus bombacis TaxID=401625 RepID=A0A0P1BNA0_9BASI|nr:hypothetical protein CBOM_07744 [Ceraceosorus bombacis]
MVYGMRSIHEARIKNGSLDYSAKRTCPWRLEPACLRAKGKLISVAVRINSGGASLDSTLIKSKDASGSPIESDEAT